MPVPVTTRETLPPFAVKLTFALTVADVVGVKRTVTTWVAPVPTRLNGVPETTLKGAEIDAAPETVPPPVFDTLKV
jgi:hypothetical protein